MDEAAKWLLRKPGSRSGVNHRLWALAKANAGVGKGFTHEGARGWLLNQSTSSPALRAPSPPFQMAERDGERIRPTKVRALNPPNLGAPASSPALGVRKSKAGEDAGAPVHGERRHPVIRRGRGSERNTPRHHFCNQANKSRICCGVRDSSKPSGMSDVAEGLISLTAARSRTVR